VHGLALPVHWIASVFLWNTLEAWQAAVVTYIAHGITRTHKILVASSSSVEPLRDGKYLWSPLFFMGFAYSILVESLAISIMITDQVAIETAVYFLTVFWVIALSLYCARVLIMLRGHIRDIGSLSAIIKSALLKRLRRLLVFIVVIGSTLTLVGACLLFRSASRISEGKTRYSEVYQESYTRYSFKSDVGAYALLLLNAFFLYYSWISGSRETGSDVTTPSSSPLTNALIISENSQLKLSTTHTRAKEMSSTLSDNKIKVLNAEAERDYHIVTSMNSSGDYQRLTE